MKLAYWMYAGPAHIGTLRVASSFKNVHAIMHAPLGDDYFNVMRSMLERERDFTPVTASIVDRHVLARGSQEKVVENIQRKNTVISPPDLILVTPTCTSSILQEDLQHFIDRVEVDAKENQLKNLKAKKERELSRNDQVPKDVLPPTGEEKDEVTDNDNHSLSVLLADVNHYRVNELQAADRTLEQIVRFYIEKARESGYYRQDTDNVSLLSTAKPFEVAKRPISISDGLQFNNEKRESNEQINSGIVGQPSETSENGGSVDVKWLRPPHTTGLLVSEKPSANIIGMFTLGFHNQHDCRELKRLLNDLGITVNAIIPEGGDVKMLKNLPKAWFNIVPYREVGLMTAVYLEKEFNMPYTDITPMGIIDTSLFIHQIAKICQKIDNEHKRKKENGSFNKSKILDNDQVIQYINQQTQYVSQAAWFSRSIDCQNLTGKKAVVFGDATHAASMTRILVREMGIHVVCAGSYCKHDADWFREQVEGFCDRILITDDHSQIGDIIAKIEPAAIFGTQMERHVGKRLDIPCGVISAPVHIQNFPLGFKPFLGYEGTNQIADLVYNSFSLGMEDHLLEIFNGHDNKEVITREYSSQGDMEWTSEALSELSKVPGFVRAKVKRNTEKYALLNKKTLITVELMYAAKESVGS
jgi:light-independent protochlorophyllide reductase subunit B